MTQRLKLWHLLLAAFLLPLTVWAADTMWSALTALTGANLALDDRHPVLDVSDTAHGAGGTAKTVRDDELRLSSGRVIAPTPASDQNDYAPTDWNGTNVASTMRISPSKTERVWQLTGVAGGFDGRLMRIVNDSTDYLFILNHENASSTAANRLNNGGSTVFLLPRDAATYVYYNSRWYLTGLSTALEEGPLRAHASAVYFEEFAGRVTSATAGVVGIMSTSASGTGGAVATSVTDVTTGRKAFGSVSLATGTTTTGRAGVGTNPAIAPTLGPAFSLQRLSLGALSDGTDTYRVTCGIQDAYDAAGEPADGLYWEYDSPTSTDWRVTASGASTRTKQTVTGFTVAASTMYDLGVWANSNWSRVDWFYSTDGLAWTVPALGVTDANIPTGTEITGLGCKILKSAGTNSRNLFMDFMTYVQPYAR